MNATRVLCVENHPGYMGALKSMLAAAGYEVTGATTGGQGLRLLTDLHVDEFFWNATCRMLLAGPCVPR